MPFMVGSLILVLVSVFCFAVVLLHAFQRSVGTGFMVLCIPFYALYYGFGPFEHARKGWLMAGWIGCGVLGVVVRGLTLSAA